jgi:anti-anti-sigma factor
VSQSRSLPGWDGHLLLVYASEHERRAGVAAWARRGLDRDEKLFYGELENEAPERSVVTVLREAGVDVDAAQRDGRLVVLPLPEFYPAITQQALVTAAYDEGYAAIRTSADSRAALTIMPVDEYARFERLIDELIRRASMSALCQYDHGLMTAGWLGPATAQHLGGLRERQLYTGGDDGTVALGGRVDAKNNRLFEAVLNAAASAAPEVLRLDMQGLTLLSAQGCRTLVDATAEYRSNGGQVRLVGVTGTVAHAVRMLGLDTVMPLEPPRRDT